MGGKLKVMGGKMESAFKGTLTGKPVVLQARLA
jgi:hypothetical protein